MVLLHRTTLTSGVTSRLRDSGLKACLCRRTGAAPRLARRPLRPAVSLGPAGGSRHAGRAKLFHTTSQLQRRNSPTSGTSPPDGTGATNFGDLDIFGNTPIPSTSVDVCHPHGFRLNNGLQSLDGSGVLLVGGEAFLWRPWGPRATLLNARGQWEVDNSSFGLLGLLWPRPDLLILGLGPEMRPLSPKTKRYITSLGMRIEVLDTRNAASQYNLLATERGVDDIAAALVPIGWREGRDGK